MIDKGAILLERAVPEASTERPVRGSAPPEPPTPCGFRWEECSGGLRLHFPPPDRRPKVGVTRWLGLGSLGAVVATGVLAALGHPFGDRVTVAAVVLAVVGGVFTLMSLLDDARRRYLARQAFSWLTVGPGEVTAEDRAGRRQSWPRTAVLDVRVDRWITGDIEPGNSQVCYVVRLFLEGGSPVPLWSRVTLDDVPFFRATEYDEANIRAATAWLSSTLRRALELSQVAGGETAVGG